MATQKESILISLLLMLAFAWPLPARAVFASANLDRGESSIAVNGPSDSSDRPESARPRANSALGAFVKEYEFHSPKCGPSIVKIDREDNVWIAMARAEKIARFHEGELREYSLPPKSFPVGIAVDSSGQVWYSDIRRNKIGRLDPTNGAVKDYDIPTRDSWPFYIVLDLEGKLWFTERMGNNIGRLDPIAGEITEFPIPTKFCAPAGMITTPGGEIFFTENAGNKVGRLDPKTGKITEYDFPVPTTPSPFFGLAGVASDSQGNVWCVQVDGRLGLIRHGQTAIEQIPVPNPASRPAGITVDQWGIVWFTELDGNCITSYDPALHEFMQYRVPTGSPDPRPMGPPEATARGEMPVPGFTAKTSRPFGIAVDSKGRVWFSEQYAHKFGVVSPPPSEIFQPSGMLSGPSASVKVQLRLPGKDNQIRYSVDDKSVPLAESLDLTLLSPGPHTFKVSISKDGEQQCERSSAFTVNPNLASIRRLLDYASRGAGSNSQMIQPILNKIRVAEQKIAAGETSVAREILRGLISDVASSERALTPQIADLLSADLRYIDLFGRREYQVEITDAPPYFKPNRIEVEVGDTVTWEYKAVRARKGAITHALAARNGDFNSPQLEPGATWSHTFSQEGELEYVCASHVETGASVVIKPRTTLILEFPLPGADRVPNVLSIDRDGNIWFTEGGGGFSRLAAVPLNNKIGKMSPDGKITEYETPTLESGPTSIHVGKEGHVWFTERGGNKIGELDPATGKIKEHLLPTAMAAATGINIDQEGKVWFTEKAASKIGFIDPQTGSITEYNTPSPNSQPSTITVDGAGNIWFDERASDKIVSLNFKTGQMREYTVPTPASRVVGLSPDASGHLWFLELGANKVGCLHIETGQVTEYAIPTKYSSPFKMAIDRQGRVWFTEVFGNKLGMLNNGRFYEFAIPTKDSMPGGIIIDSKGNIWFSEQAGNKLAMVPSVASSYTDAGDGDILSNNTKQARRQQ